MPTVLATAAFAAVLGFAWRRFREPDRLDDGPEIERRGPTELVDVVPLTRGDDGVWRPEHRDA